VGKLLCNVLVWVWIIACFFIHLHGSLCVTKLMFVSGAPAYLVHLLVGVCPALVVLRVVFAYVHQTSHHTIYKVLLSMSNDKDLMMATTSRNM